MLVLGLLGPHKEEEEALYSEVVVRLHSRSRESSFTQSSSSKTPKLLMTPTTQRREREGSKAINFGTEKDMYV